MTRLFALSLLASLAPSSASERPPSEGPISAMPLASDAPSFVVRVVGRSRPAMILIPGLACSGEVWDGAVEHYRSRYQLHVLTLAGFAGQPPISASLLAAVRRDLARYIREHRLEKPVVVGHSLGGFLAFALAADEPALVGPVISVDGVAFLPALLDSRATSETARPWADSMRARITQLTLEQRAAQGRAAASGMVNDPDAVDRIASWALKSDARTVANALFELNTTDLRSALSRLRSPILLVGAGHFAGDPAAQAALSARYEGQIAAAPVHRFVLAKNARHFVMLDDPATLFAAMDDFLATSDRSSVLIRSGRRVTSLGIGR